MSVHLKNRNVFITGASSGIGKACALAFAREGSNLLLAARRKDRIDTLARNLEKTYGVMTHSIQLDVRNHDEVAAAMNIAVGTASAALSAARKSLAVSLHDAAPNDAAPNEEHHDG